MPDDLKLLIRKLALFFLPFVLYGLVIAAIDPYDYFGGPSPFSVESKRQVGLPLNYALWKVLDYRRAPTPNILLGDSRMMSMKPETIAEVAGLDYANLAYGGGSLREAIDTFWYADGLVTLERVCLGINLNNYSAYDNKDRVSEAVAILENPFLYLVNLNVLDAAAKLVTGAVTGKPARIGKPAGSREQFWRHQIDAVAREMYTNYTYPAAYHADLVEVSEYCRDHGIELAFLVFPSHRDLQDQVAAFGLEAAQERMLADLAELGTVFDFELANEITADAENYTDPFHFKPEIMKTIIEGVWGGGNRFVEIRADHRGPED
jgi:hypothetical protein